MENMFPKSEFKKNVITLMSATTIAQVISVLVSPVITRLYAPESFGIYALYSSMATLFGLAAAGRYEFAIVLPQKKKEAFNIIALSILIILGVFIILLAATIFFNKQIADVLNNRDIGKWLYLIPFSVMLVGLYQTFNYWFNRVKDFGKIARSRVIQVLTTVTAQIGMGFLGFTPAGLIVGRILGQILSAGYLGWKFLAGERRDLLKDVSLGDMKQQAGRYSNFPKFDALNALFYGASVEGIIILLSRLFGATAVGFYSFTFRILVLPYAFFGIAFSEVFYQKLAHVYNADVEHFPGLINKAIDKIIFFTAIPFFVLVFLSKYFVPFVFGAKWIGLHVYIYILAPLVYLNLIFVPVSHVLKILNKQHVSLAQNFLLFFNKTCAILLGFYLLHFDIIKTLLLFSIVGTATAAINTMVIFRISKVSVTRRLIALLIFELLAFIYISGAV